MKKIPTIFLRDPEHRAYVTREPHPDCAWVFAGEGVATRKYDGTCVVLHEQGWFARREVKPGKAAPPNYVPVEFDEATGKTVGWEPIGQSSFAKVWRDAFENDERHEGIRGGFALGTYELIGPKVNGNPERAGRHQLVRHGVLELPDAPRDFDGLAKYLTDPTWHWEGIVWHHPDGRMAKLKRRDFPAVPAVTVEV